MGVKERVRQTEFRNPAARAWVSLIVAADALTQESDAIFQRHDLTGDQYNVLRILRGAGASGHPRGEITKRLLRRAPDMTRMLDRLESRGWVERSQDESDLRVTRARITPAGLNLLRRIDPELERLMMRRMAALSAGEVRQLAQLCDKLLI